MRGTIDDEIAAIEGVLETIVISDTLDPSAHGFRLIDRLQGARATGSLRAHLGVSVTVPETVNTDRVRARLVREVEDTAEVLLLHQVAPHDQKQSRTDAAGHEEQIRAALVNRLRAWHVSYRSTSRALVDGWLETRIRLRFRRLEAITHEG